MLRQWLNMGDGATQQTVLEYNCRESCRPPLPVYSTTESFNADQWSINTVLNTVTTEYKQSLEIFVVSVHYLHTHTFKLFTLYILLPVYNEKHSAAFFSCIKFILWLIPKTLIVFALLSKLLCQSILLSCTFQTWIVRIKNVLLVTFW